jgi:hypothetical protein
MHDGLLGVALSIVSALPILLWVVWMLWRSPDGGE